MQFFNTQNLLYEVWPSILTSILDVDNQFRWYSLAVETPTECTGTPNKTHHNQVADGGYYNSVIGYSKMLPQSASEQD